MRTRAGRLQGSLAVAVAAALAAAAAAPAAVAPAPFAFADADALTTDCAELIDGVDMVIRNETARSQPLTVAVGRITDAHGAEVNATGVCDGLTAEISEPAADAEGVVEVEAGAEAIVTLSAEGEVDGEATFSTTLVAHADAGAVARRAATISEQAPAGTAAVPLIASRDVAHQRFDPCDSWIVWVPVKLPASEAPALTPGETVGVLSGERGTAAVTYGDEKPKKLTGETSLVPLHVEAVGAGKYVGAVDLTDAADTGVVALTLTAKHWWPLALLPILAGLALALIIQWLNGYRQTRARLLDRVRDSTQVRADARQRLEQAAGGADWGKFDVSGADLDKAQGALRAEVEKRTESKWVLIDQKIVDDLTAKVDALEKKILALDTIGQAAPLLVDAITKLSVERPPESELPPLQGSDLTRVRPRLIDAAEELLAGAELTADALVERATALTAMTAAVRALREYDQALKHYWTLAAELEANLTDPADRAEVARLKSVLEGLRHRLWDVDAPKLVDSTAAGFDSVRAKVDELWPRLPDPKPPLWHVVTRRVLPPIALGPAALDALYSRALAAHRLARPQAGYGDLLEEVDADLGATLAGGDALSVAAPTARVGPSPMPVPTPPATPALPRPPARVPLSAAEADRVIAAARTTQWVVLVVAFVVAVVTAYSALYVGQAWGTPWDYLFAAAWALVTQGVLTAIAAAVGGLGALASVRQGMFAPRL